jgi:hypothetical protein
MHFIYGEKIYMIHNFNGISPEILYIKVMFSIDVLPWVDHWVIFIYRGKFQDYLGLTCVFWNGCVLHKGYVTGTRSQAPEGSSVTEVRFVVAGRASQILSRGAICKQTQQTTRCSHTPHDSDTSLHLKTFNSSQPLRSKFTFSTVTVLTIKLRPCGNGWRWHVPSKRRHTLTKLYGVRT